MIRPGMYNGFDWYGRILELREVKAQQHIDVLTLIDRHCLGPLCRIVRIRWFPRRIAGPPGVRGGLRGSPYGGRGGYGRGGYVASGRNTSDQDLYKDYSGPDQQAGGYAGTYDGYAGGFGGGYGAAGYESEPSQQIIVRDVSQISVLALDWQSS